jgi:D-3-phosphoglycerate dehydrogenase / 2-oxoglutarate reductase
MSRILANDGIDAAGKAILEKAGIEVVTDKFPQEDLINQLPNYDGILVRSATTVRKELIDALPNLKVIGRAGVGMDNIDVEHARSKGIHVINTPEASAQSVAELVFASMFAIARFIPDASRKMPDCASKEQFNALKKDYSAGFELKDKTIGIIGFGSIGQSVARIAIGLGMRVLPFRRSGGDTLLDLKLHPSYGDIDMTLTLRTVELEELFEHADFITVHTPFKKGTPPLIGKEEIAKMKNQVVLVNTARGGVINETDLIDALNSGKVAAAAVDVFEGEPEVRESLRKHPHVITTPHIGGSTKEAQERIGIELAEKVVRALKGN